MEHSRTTSLAKTHTKLFWLILIAAPLLLAIMWGPYLPAEVYTFLRFVRGIAEGAGMVLDIVGEFPTPTVDNLLFAFLVSIPTRIGVDPAWAALLLSAAGWIVAAFAMLAVGQSIKRPDGAMIAALLLSFSPAILSTLGRPTSWIVAWGWLTVALLLRRHFLLAALTFLLLVALQIPWPLTTSWSRLAFHGAAVVWSILLFAAGIGADWLADTLVNKKLVRLNAANMKTILLVAVFILIGLWQGMRIWQLVQERNEMLWQLEEEVGAWLRTETNETATLLADERIGYLAQRPTATLPDIRQLETATAVQALLQAQPVDFLVATDDLRWQQLRELVWFRLAYEPVKQFNHPYLPEAPFTILAYRQPLAELGQQYSLNARVPDRLWIIGYQIGPQQVRAGEFVQMALYIEAPEATFETPTAFQAIVRLISPIDYGTVREWIVDLPQTISPQEWQAEQVIVEQFPLKMPDALEAGAYLLNLSLLGPESDELWPLSLDNDFNRLDRVPTGYVIVPADRKPLDDLQPIEADLGSEIRLSGFITSKAETDEELDVTLLWEVKQPVNEDYVVFVHMVDSSGQLVANHDGVPGNGRFPTRAWQPGINIPDTHSILIPAELPAGEYLLKVGLYNPDTGERLTAAAADGSVSEDNSIHLSTISWP